ncbi:hypothetical protein ACIBFB_22145 [Nocardiopsis sp. NPDC050513]|uniref:hypothetical protein n=1 Tax=Nocardiopsis sp. NPDC050513 TaxID=3364338 RepID=UPI0037881F43
MPVSTHAPAPTAASPPLGRLALPVLAVVAAALTACAPASGSPGSEASDADGAAASESPAEGAGGTPVELGGVTLTLPDGWGAEPVSEEVGALSDPEGERERVSWLALYPEGQAACAGTAWSWNDLGSGCRHLKVFGPEVLDYAGPGYVPMDVASGTGAAYAPSSDPGPCSEEVALHGQGDLAGGVGDGWSADTVPVAGGQAIRATGSVPCFDTGASDFASFEQSVWLLEGPDVLVVDDYGLDGTEGLVSSARW